MRSIKKNINILWNSLEKKEKINIILLFFLMFVGSFLEMASIGSIIPFIAAATGSINEDNKYYSLFIKLFPVGTSSLVAFGIAFSVIAISSGIMRFIQSWANTYVSFEIGKNVTKNIYESILSKDYEYHLGKNSSDFISMVVTKSNAILYGIILPTLNLFSSLLFLVAIYIGLILIDPVLSFITIIFFIIFYFLITHYVKSKLNIIGIKISINNDDIIKILQQSFLSIKDIILDNSQNFYSNKFTEVDSRLRDAQASGNIYSVMPRYFIETISMVAISFIVILNSEKNSSELIPVLGAIGLAITKALPLFQQCYNSIAQISINAPQLDQVNDLLIENKPFQEKISYNQNHRVERIELDNISYRYEENQKFALKNVSLSAINGSVVGVIGSSGSGKTTLINIMMGLLPPTEGTIRFVTYGGEAIDPNKNKLNIAHVPQDIFIEDDTLYNNINLKYYNQKTDIEKIDRILNIVGLNYLKINLEYRLGENGSKLSGGERQRIAIARALYKDADLIYFDEITSALDEKSEKIIIENMKASLENKLIVLITHRPEILKICDVVIAVENGNVVFTK